MKNFDSMNDKKMVSQNIWKLFDAFRGSISTEDYYIILLFIYLRSENLLNQALLDDQNPKNALIDILKNAKSSSIQNVFDVFEPLISRVSETTLAQAIEILLTCEDEWFKQNISQIYDESLEMITLSQGTIGGQSFQPQQLTEFIKKYLGSTEDLKIYNPFAGAASFVKDCNNSKSSLAQEVNQRTWAVGKLRLLANGSNTVFNCEDSISNWPQDEKFDLIVTTPPFGLRLNPNHEGNFLKCITIEEFIIRMGLESLSEKGKIVIVMPQSFLFRGGTEKRLRTKLINEDLIDTIITFPGGLFYHTGIPFAVLVLNKTKSNPGKIKVVDATSFIDKPRHRVSLIQVDRLVKEINDNQNSAFVRSVTNEDVVANTYNLSVPRYFQEEIEGVQLKEILSPFRGERPELPISGKILRIRDLKDDKVNFKLNTNDIEESIFNRPDAFKIESSCLLLSVRWNSLKPTYFHFDGVPIYSTTDISSFHINTNIADISYIVNELHAEYVLKQIQGLRVGGSIPYIRKEDLLEVKIKLPSLEVQRAKVAGLNEISEKISQLQNERNQLAHGLSAKEFNEFASLKHTLGRPRQNILGWSKNLSNFFVRQGDSISDLNEDFKELFGLGIIEAISEINRDIKFISEVLEKGENGLVLTDYNKEIVTLAEINNLINNLSNNEFSFSIQKKLFRGEEMKTRGISINRILFRTLIDNLLTNANKYGFRSNEKGNHVFIELTEIEGHLIMDVRNNGLPFPKNFDREKFITKYSTADNTNGSGLGGYDINRIATYFENENWELSLNNDPLYPVIFRFSFPIKSMK
jgi:type I restriction enzyme M protein